jgi:hypothetical protein
VIMMAGYFPLKRGSSVATPCPRFSVAPPQTKAPSVAGQPQAERTICGFGCCAGSPVRDSAYRVVKLARGREEFHRARRASP